MSFFFYCFEFQGSTLKKKKKQQNTNTNNKDKLSYLSVHLTKKDRATRCHKDTDLYTQGLELAAGREERAVVLGLAARGRHRRRHLLRLSHAKQVNGENKEEEEKD